MPINPQCVAEVLVEQPVSYGSGYVIGAGLVLTARHVVEAAGDGETACPTRSKLDREYGNRPSCCEVASASRDEAFFVDAALGAPGSPVRETVRDVDAGLREPFESFDLVLLLNVPAPSKADAARP